MSNAADDNLMESGNDHNLRLTGQLSPNVEQGLVEAENNSPVVEPPRVFGDDLNGLPDGEEDDGTEWSETDEEESYYYYEEDEEHDYEEEEEHDYEEEEDEEDHYEEEEEDDYEEEEVEGEDSVPVVEPPRVFSDASDLPDSGGGGGEEDDGIKQRRTACGGGESPEVKECKIGEIEGLFCPICMDAWTSGGDHHSCCLPCGHVYGLSCIKKWLQHKWGSGKCPQCNVKCELKDVRKLYPQRIVVIDEQMQKKIRLLESRCNALETMVNLVPKKDYLDANFTSMNRRFDKY